MRIIYRAPKSTVQRRFIMAISSDPIAYLTSIGFSGSRARAVARYCRRPYQVVVAIAWAYEAREGIMEATKKKTSEVDKTLAVVLMGLLVGGSSAHEAESVLDTLGLPVPHARNGAKEFFEILSGANEALRCMPHRHAGPADGLIEMLFP